MENACAYLRKEAQSHGARSDRVYALLNALQFHAASAHRRHSFMLRYAPACMYDSICLPLSSDLAMHIHIILKQPGKCIRTNMCQNYRMKLNYTRPLNLINGLMGKDPYYKIQVEYLLYYFLVFSIHKQTHRRYRPQDTNTLKHILCARARTLLLKM